MLPEIRSRMRLTICDATTAMFERRAGYKPEHSWRYNGLLVSEDPVALDYIQAGRLSSENGRSMD